MTAPNTRYQNTASKLTIDKQTYTNVAAKLTAATTPCALVLIFILAPGKSLTCYLLTYLLNYLLTDRPTD